MDDVIPSKECVKNYVTPPLCFKLREVVALPRWQLYMQERATIKLGID